jgi:uncharacterized protein (TIGR02117 family)
LCALASGCAVQPPPVLPNEPRTETIYVIGRGCHTDIGVAAARVTGELEPLRRLFPGTTTFTFGFGARAWLLDTRKGLDDVVQALLPAPGAILVTALRTSPVEAFGADHVVTLAVTPAGLDRLLRFLAASFQLDRNGAPRLLTSGPYMGSAFYAASPTYDAVHTCNTWTAEAIRAAGVPVTTSGVLFASQIMAQARAVAAIQNAPVVGAALK